MADCYNWLDHRFLVTESFTTACFRNVGGIYIFAKSAPIDRWMGLKVGITRVLAQRLKQEAWAALYIGKATNLAQRLSLDRRPHWAAAKRLGATHVHILFVSYPWSRSEIERRLIEEFDPPVNRYLRKKRVIRAHDLGVDPAVLTSA